MRILLRTLLESLRAAESGRVSAIWQGILHVAAIYFIARLFVPWLLDGVHGELIPFLLGHPSGGNPLQFFFSHLLALSVLPGFVAGLVNATFLRNRVACFVWLVPALVLFAIFLFDGPGMYPTMLWKSDFRQAFHFFFGGEFRMVGEYHNYLDLPTLIQQNTRDFLRGYAQLRVTVPVYVGVAYSIGAWLSLGIKKTRAHPPGIEAMVVQATPAS